MRLLQDGVVAALAAIGLTAVIFLLVSAIVHPRRRGTIPATAVIETCGEQERRSNTRCARCCDRAMKRAAFRASSSWTAALPTSRAAWRSSCAAANTRSTSAKGKN